MVPLLYFIYIYLTKFRRYINCGLEELFISFASFLSLCCFPLDRGWADAVVGAWSWGSQLRCTPGTCDGSTGVYNHSWSLGGWQQESRTTPGFWAGGGDLYQSPEPVSALSWPLWAFTQGKKSIIQYHPSPHTHHKQWQLASKVAQPSSAYTPSHCWDSCPSPIVCPSPLPGFYFWSPSFSIQPAPALEDLCQAEECRTSALTICAVLPVLWLQRNGDCIFLWGCQTPFLFLATLVMGLPRMQEPFFFHSSLLGVQLPSWFPSCFPFPTQLHFDFLAFLAVRGLLPQ